MVTYCTNNLVLLNMRLDDFLMNCNTLGLPVVVCIWANE